MEDKFGIVDTVKAKFSQYSGALHLDSAKAVEILSYTGVSFLFGFLFKRYFRSAFWVAACFFGVFFVLTYLGFVYIDWSKVYSATGIAPTDTFSTVGNSFFLWVQHNILVAIGALAGFVLGYSIG